MISTRPTRTAPMIRLGPIRRARSDVSMLIRRPAIEDRGRGSRRRPRS
jgi:hypothetical protein